jgi:hypothetical protein
MPCTCPNRLQQNRTTFPAQGTQQVQRAQPRYAASARSLIARNHMRRINALPG